MALQNNPTLAQSAANIRAAEGRRKQSGLYPNPTVGYQGEEIRGGSFRGGEQGFFVRQDIVMGGKLGLNRKIFEQEKKQAETEADEQKLRVLTNVRMSYIQALAAQQMRLMPSRPETSGRASCCRHYRVTPSTACRTPMCWYISCPSNRFR